MNKYDFDFEKLEVYQRALEFANMIFAAIMIIYDRNVRKSVIC